MPSAPMRQEVERFMAEHEPEPAHARHVRDLALSLFDQMAARHGLGDVGRFLLDAAALLHDIGWSVAPDGRRHHKLARDMIRSHPWQTLPRRAVEIIALVARYHRKSPPRPRHSDYAALAPRSREVVRKLAAILRVADALDRSHRSSVAAIGVIDHGSAISLWLSTDDACDGELAAAQNKKDLFEAEYRVPLDLEIRPLSRKP